MSIQVLYARESVNRLPLICGCVDLIEDGIQVPDEREPRADLIDRLAGLRIPKTIDTWVAADTSEDGEVLGVCVLDHFYESRCAMITYLVVHRDHRGKGKALDLIHTLVSHVSALRPIRAVYAELEDPERLVPGPVRDYALKRSRTYSRWGAQVVPCRHIQPPLAPSLSYVEHMKIVSLPVAGRDYSAKTFLDFERDFYITLGIQDPDGDPYFQQVLASAKPVPSVFFSSSPSRTSSKLSHWRSHGSSGRK